MDNIAIQLEIDALKEYIEAELCKKCEEMQKQLIELENKLKDMELDKQ